MSVSASSLRFGRANALPCNRPLEYGGYYLSKKSGAVQFYRAGSHRNRAAKTGFFEYLQEYVISGSVFQESSWRKGRLYPKPAAYRNRKYLWGTLLRFGKTGNVVRFLLDGWSGPNKGGTWTGAKAARLGLEVDPPNNDTVLLSATLRPFIVPDKLPHQRVLIHINDNPVGEWTLTEKPLRIYSLAVPATHFQDEEIVIGFKFPNATSPKDIGMNRDVRTLAAHFRDITLHDGHEP